MAAEMSRKNRLTAVTVDRIPYSCYTFFVGEMSHHNGRRFSSHHPKGGEPMRITLHIGGYTVTIIVKKRENRHSGK